jgi:hypothetical protein
MSETRFNECKNKPGYFDVFQKDLANRNKKSGIGLGDVVDFVTTVTGIKKIVNAISGGGCGCEARKDKLNDIRLL